MLLGKQIILAVLQLKFQSCVRIIRTGNAQPENVLEIVKIGTNIEGMADNLEIYKSFLESPVLISWSKMCDSPELGMYSWDTNHFNNTQVVFPAVKYGSLLFSIDPYRILYCPTIGKSGRRSGGQMATTLVGTKKVFILFCFFPIPPFLAA